MKFLVNLLFLTKNSFSFKVGICSNIQKSAICCFEGIFNYTLKTIAVETKIM
jgi:hypothetical protein